ncbi:MAG TPA: glycosyltransferase family 4 protein, partial [Methylomirabilota bacterium]|nr:glycosyltransferase family 4 protein [Methylomirabilota bacterium]
DVSGKDATGRAAAMPSTGPPYRVLFIENSRGLGGSTVSLCNLLSGLDRKVIEPIAAFARTDQRQYAVAYCGPSVRTELVPFTRTLAVSAALRSLLSWAARGPMLTSAASAIPAVVDDLFLTLPTVSRLYRLGRAHGVQCIHQNNGFDVSAVVAARLLGVPILAYQRGREWNSPAVRFFCRFVDLFLANSQATREILRGLGVSSERICVVYPPVDVELFNPAGGGGAARREFAVERDQRTFGIIGSLRERKGHRVFLRAAARVMREQSGARAFVIGEAAPKDAAYRQELMHLADELGIRDRVTFTGFRSDVKELIELLDVVAVPSVKPEPFGRVIIEAMAMGKPVVASRAGGPPEIITHEENGLLVTPNEHEPLAAAITRLLSDRDFAATIAARGQQDARRRFSLSTHVEIMQAVYTTLISTGRGPVPVEALAGEARR